MTVYLTGVVRPFDRYGQMVLRLDDPSKAKLTNLERVYQGKSPRFHGEAALKLAAEVKRHEVEPLEGRFVTVKAAVTRYSFYSNGKAVKGWRLVSKKIGAGPALRPITGVGFEDSRAVLVSDSAAPDTAES